MRDSLEAAIKRTGRSCGECSLCCKLPPIPVLEKPANTWCRHCKPGKGCGIYSSRPDICQNFGCKWLTDATFGDEWKPSHARIVVTRSRALDGQLDYLFMVDPAFPHRWREEPYYSAIQRLAALGSAGVARFRTVVLIGSRTFLVRVDKTIEVPADMAAKARESNKP